jgi:hypothetical protein
MCWKLTDITLSTLGSLKQLSKLDLSHCEQFTAAGLTALGQGATSLQILSIPACWQISDDHLEAIANHMLLLSSLGLFESGESVTDDGLSQLVKLSSTLTALDLGYSCWFHTSQGLQNLLTHLTALKMLNLSGCEGVCDDTLSMCMGMRRSISEGGGRGGENTVGDHHDAVPTNNNQSSVLYHHPYLSQLTQLDISECQRVTPQGLTHLGNLPNLVHLNLGWNLRLSPGALSCLLGNGGGHRESEPSVPRYHHHYHRLHLKQQQHASPPLLSHLDLSFCGELTDEALKTIGHLPMLKSLVLRKCTKLTDNGISYLANTGNGSSGIESLDLSYCTGLSEGTALYVSQLPCLEKLVMVACPRITTPLAMAQLTCCTGGGGEAGGRGSLKYLNMSDNQRVDDECLNALTTGGGGKNMLMELNFRGCSKITDRGVLVGLQHMKQLRRLNVDLCVNVSCRALSELQRRLPLLKRVKFPQEAAAREWRRRDQVGPSNPSNAARFIV